jgi:hypothetical protein
MKHYRCAILSFAALAALVPAAPAADKPQTVKGRVEEVSASAHRLKVLTDEGKELALRVDGRSKLEQEGRAVALDEFKKGTRVQVTFEPRGGENRVVSLATAPVSAAELREEIREALRAAKSYSFRQKDAYRKRLERVLARADDRIAHLQAEAERAGARAQKKYARQIKELRRLRDRAAKRAERVKSATPSAWEDLKSGVSAALEDLRKALE